MIHRVGDACPCFGTGSAIKEPRSRPPLGRWGTWRAPHHPLQNAQGQLRRGPQRELTPSIYVALIRDSNVADRWTEALAMPRVCTARYEVLVPRKAVFAPPLEARRVSRAGSHQSEYHQRSIMNSIHTRCQPENQSSCNSDNLSLHDRRGLHRAYPAEPAHHALGLD